MVANISDDSTKVLRNFALGKHIAVEELIGDGDGQYEDFNHLKRSFVGAVNRRLRTVLRNRLAVLFSSDRDKKRIKITPRAAASLRQALDVAEPMPTFDFVCRESGTSLLTDSDDANKLRELLNLAWKGFSGRPEKGEYRISEKDLLKHFIDQGFQASVATPNRWKEASLEVAYSFDTPESSEQLRTRLEVPFNSVDEREHDLNYEFPLIFLSHEDLPGVMAGQLNVSLPRRDFIPNEVAPPDIAKTSEILAAIRSKMEKKGENENSIRSFISEDVCREAIRNVALEPQLFLDSQRQFAGLFEGFLSALDDLVEIIEEKQSVRSKEEANYYANRFLSIATQLDPYPVSGRARKEYRDMLERAKKLPSSSEKALEAELNKRIARLNSSPIAQVCRLCGDKKMHIVGKPGAFVWRCDKNNHGTLYLNRAQLKILDA